MKKPKEFIDPWGRKVVPSDEKLSVEVTIINPKSGIRSLFKLVLDGYDAMAEAAAKQDGATGHITQGRKEMEDILESLLSSL
jgi:hypothetical protein